MPSTDAAEVTSSRRETESLSENHQETTTITAYFTPPVGWRFTDKKTLSPNVQIMVVGKGEKEYPPSINLTTEPYKGTLKQYLKIVKGINDSQGASWKDLGTIKTEAGLASLSQILSKTVWGEVKMMHMIYVNNDIVYILTAASLKEEFPKFYNEFFKSLRSFNLKKESLDTTTLLNRG